MTKTAKAAVETAVDTADAKSADARARLVSAATELFVAKGYRGVSIREIADRADSNSALISYYFSDKEGLFKHVFKAVAEPLNRARFVNFDRLEDAGEFTLESVVHAWVTPMFEGLFESQENPVSSLSLSLNAEQGELAEKLIVEVYDEVNERFLSLLSQCIPNVSRPTLVWRLYFLVGAVLTAMRPRTQSMRNLSMQQSNAHDSRELIAQMVAYASAGFRASEPRRGRAALRAKMPLENVGEADRKKSGSSSS